METIESSVLKLLEKHDVEFKIRNGQATTKYCPFCNGGDHGDKETFAVSLHNGSYNCMRGGCSVKGSFRDLCNFFGETYTESINTNFERKHKTYDAPDTSKYSTNLSSQIVEYFKSRCISEQTLRECNIMQDEDGNIVFPLYEKGNIVGAKFRKPYKHDKTEGPKEWAIRNMKPVLFGMNNVSYNRPLFITEGEIDALSLYEAGYTNVVSVAMGCNNFEFVELCWDWLERFNEIILFGDSDEPGITFVSTLAKRLGEERCMLPPSYPDLIVDGKNYSRACKDANEILYAYGIDGLREIADACQPVPIKGIINLADVQMVEPDSIPRIYSRIPALDDAIGGFAEGTLTIMTGKRGEGKSTLNGQLLLNAIQQDYRVCAYSGELSAQKFLEWVMLQATERKYITTKVDKHSGKTFAYVPTEIQRRIKEWIDGKFFLFDNTCVIDTNQQDAIISVFTACAKRYGCKMFLVDNMMSAITSTDDEYKAQGKFTSALKNFAVKYNVAVILIAHPRKTKAGEALTSEDVAGSANITNLADTVISVEKPNLRITKNREFGECIFIECNYDPSNRRIFQNTTGDRTMYGWDHEGIELPEVQACNMEAFKIRSGTKAPAAPF